MDETIQEGINFLNSGCKSYHVDEESSVLKSKPSKSSNKLSSGGVLGKRSASRSKSPKPKKAKSSTSPPKKRSTSPKKTGSSKKVASTTGGTRASRRLSPSYRSPKKSDTSKTSDRSTTSGTGSTSVSGEDEEFRVERVKYTAYAGRTTIDEAPRDIYDNALGNKYDLVEDGTFRGLTVLVLQLYGFDFSEPQKVLREKGFRVIRCTKLPSLEEFRDQLNNASQLWIISGAAPQISTP
jgi:hypothetical protein